MDIRKNIIDFIIFLKHLISIIYNNVLNLEKNWSIQKINIINSGKTKCVNNSYITGVNKLTGKEKTYNDINKI